MNKIAEIFNHISRKVASVTGSPWGFIAAFLTIIVWALSGPLFKFSDTWQLVINTSTTIVTFLMVFLIQGDQNRQSKAIQLKLDELIKSIKGARNSMVDLEKLSDEELKKLEDEFENLHVSSKKIRHHRKTHKK